LAELTPEQLNAINDGLREQEQLLAAITSRTQAQQNLLEANRRIQQQVNDALSETRTEREKELAQIQATIKEAERQNRLLQEQVTAIYAAGRANGQLTEQQKDQIRLLEDQIDANNTVASQLEIENELRQDSISVAEGILETTLGISKQQSGVVGLLQKSVNSGKSFGESLRDVGSDLAEGMAEVLTTRNV
jgi:type I site-specific restriction endonuclease